VKIRAIHNYAEDTGRGVILVEAPPAAPRGQAKELNRGGSQLAKITAIGAIILLISAVAYLGCYAKPAGSL